MPPVLNTVLGASGFVGRRIADRLRLSGAQVWAPSRAEIAADDYRALTRRPLGRVYYCIGLTADYAQDPLATFDAHCRVLAKLVREGDFDRIVYLSSTRLYDGGDGRGIEDAALRLSPAESRHLFDLTKALGEHFTLVQSGGRGLVARLSCVYDTTLDATGFLPELLRRLDRERGFDLPSNPQAQRDYVLADDAVTALIAILDCGEPGTIFNVASGENVSNAELVERINAAGWNLRLTGRAEPVTAPRIDISRLRSLGVEPRRLGDFLSSYLDRPIPT